MQDVVQVQYESLEEIASRFGAEAESNRTQYERVTQLVAQLQGGNWIGRGADSFYSEVSQVVSPAMGRFIGALEEAQQVTLQISEILKSAEEEAAHPFRNGGYSPIPLNGATSPLGFATEGAAANFTRAGQPNGTPIRPAIADIPPRQYALMAQAAYEDGGHLPPELRDAGWDVVTSADSNFGYQATVYVNHQTQEVVIAHRGTDEFIGFDGLNGSDLDDDAMIMRGLPPQQYRESQNFVDQVQANMRANGMRDYTLSHTGHSLGGVLADLHASDDGVRAITFENPGSHEILKSMNRTIDPSQHVSYQSNPNLINQTNQQAGYVIQVVPHERSDRFGVIRDTLHHHSMDNLVEAINPETGFPYAHRPIVLHEYEDDVSLGLDQLGILPED